MSKQNINIGILKAIGKGGLSVLKAGYATGKQAKNITVNNPRKFIVGGGAVAYLKSDMANYPDRQRAKIMLENHKKGI